MLPSFKLLLCSIIVVEFAFERSTDFLHWENIGSNQATVQATFMQYYYCCWVLLPKSEALTCTPLFRKVNGQNPKAILFEVTCVWLSSQKGGEFCMFCVVARFLLRTAAFGTTRTQRNGWNNKTFNMVVDWRMTHLSQLNENIISPKQWIVLSAGWFQLPLCTKTPVAKRIWTMLASSPKCIHVSSYSQTHAGASWMNKKLSPSGVKDSGSDKSSLLHPMLLQSLCVVAAQRQPWLLEIETGVKWWCGGRNR